MENTSSSEIKPTESGGGADGATVNRKKRSRWGSSAEDLTALASNTSGESSTEATATGNTQSLSSVDLMASIQAAKEAAMAAANAAAVSSSSSSSSSTLALGNECVEIKKPRASRWSTNTDNVSVLPSPTDPASLAMALTIPGMNHVITPAVLTGAQLVQKAMTPEVIQQSLVLKMQLQGVTDKLLTVAVDAARIEQDPNRSPSPTPKYDSNGKRTNTREIRMREKFMEERTKLIEELCKINPTYIPPPDYVRQKPVKRIFLPNASLNPMHNYIGLIIGPRGNTQKELEQKSGAKISIRGKGSVKDGSKGRPSKQVVDEDLDLHVHITGDTDEQVAIAVKLVTDILSPSEEDLNAHKQKQLKELALINGTFKEDDYCPICGEKGHRQWECPHRAKTYKASGVKCSICGDLSHPTRDCPLKQVRIFIS
jgi:splicing factor 1